MDVRLWVFILVSEASGFSISYAQQFELWCAEVNLFSHYIWFRMIGLEFKSLLWHRYVLAFFWIPLAVVVNRCAQFNNRRIYNDFLTYFCNYHMCSVITSLTFVMFQFLAVWLPCHHSNILSCKWCFCCLIMISCWFLCYFNEVCVRT